LNHRIELLHRRGLTKPSSGVDAIDGDGDDVACESSLEFGGGSKSQFKF
jgi:hypothetical protein